MITPDRQRLTEIDERIAEILATDPHRQFHELMTLNIEARRLAQHVFAQPAATVSA